MWSTAKYMCKSRYSDEMDTHSTYLVTHNVMKWSHCLAVLSTHAEGCTCLMALGVKVTPCGMYGYVISMMHILNAHLAGWMYVVSVVVEGPNNMEFLYGGLGDLQYIKANKSHAKTPEHHTHMHIKHMHTDYTHTHTHMHISHTHTYIHHNHNWLYTCPKL